MWQKIWRNQYPSMVKSMPLIERSRLSDQYSEVDLGPVLYTTCAKAFANFPTIVQTSCHPVHYIMGCTHCRVCSNTKHEPVPLGNYMQYWDACQHSGTLILCISGSISTKLRGNMTGSTRMSIVGLIFRSSSVMVCIWISINHLLSSTCFKWLVLM